MTTVIFACVHNAGRSQMYGVGRAVKQHRRPVDDVLREPYTNFVMEAADREIRLGIWKIHILHHAASREVWGAWLLEELAEHGHRLSPGTLYPALARMEKNGWLARCGTLSHARARQVFSITPAGRALLKALQREVTELYEEVVLGREPEPPASSSATPVKASPGAERLRRPKARRRES